MSRKRRDKAGYGGGGGEREGEGGDKEAQVRRDEQFRER